MQGWHSVGTVKKKGTWDATELGGQLKTELAKGNTAKEDLGSVFKSLKQD